MDFKTGDILCNCTLLTQCGSGAYGEVWLATDPVGGRVAVKILSQRGSYSERELAGLRNYKDCNHPNLLKIRHIELRDKTIIYTMDAADNLNKDGDYLPDTLANRLRKYGRLEGKEITAMLDGLLSGLEELHGKGLVHRDIKPDNILWVNKRPTLADVGLVAAEGQGSLVGTHEFLSPDLLNGKKHADASDDFYALGKVIYCALTGMPVREYPSLPIDKTISVDKVLGKAYRKACDAKVNSSAEFRELLVSEPEKPHSKRFHKWLWLVVLAVLFILLCIAAVMWKQEKATVHPEIPQTVKQDFPSETPHQSAEVRLAPEERRRQEAFQAAQLDHLPRADEVIPKLKSLGFWDKEYLSEFLDYRPITQDEILALATARYDEEARLFWQSFRNNVNQAVSTGKVSPQKRTHPMYNAAESALQGLLIGYTDIDYSNLSQRQSYWKQQIGTPLEVQRKMLASDKLMQCIALEITILSKIEPILKAGTITPAEEKELKELLWFRSSLINS